MNVSYYITLLNIEPDLNKAYSLAQELLHKDDLMDLIKVTVKESNLNSCLI